VAGEAVDPAVPPLGVATNAGSLPGTVEPDAHPQSRSGRAGQHQLLGGELRLAEAPRAHGPGPLDCGRGPQLPLRHQAHAWLI